MSVAKIRLSEKEMELVTNADWILTKNIILDKVVELFSSLQLAQQQSFFELDLHFPLPFSSSSPKISRGENYKGLPYRVLDYPAIFGKEDIMAIRTIFWWGSFFSVALHLSGDYKKNREGKLIASYPILAAEGYAVCVHESPWQHHFGSDNYAPIDSFKESEFTELIYKKNFIKIAAKVQLDEWDNASNRLLAFFKRLIIIAGNGD
jgi:hypothetical protein